MMNLQTMLASPEYPSAILLARLSDVVMNNNILYRLVRPTEEGTEVVSVNRLVNVVPYRRVYRFDHKEELEQFANELLRRPLVIQPVVHIGRGIGPAEFPCGLCYKDDKWVMMINQTHPKILSRLQIGLDAAKKAIAQGQSCEIRFAFGGLVERIFKYNLIRQEQEKAAAMLDLFKSYFRYAEWEYGDLIIRYHGYAALLGRRVGFKEVSTLDLTFRFEDLLQDEIVWKSLGAEFFPKPHLSPIEEDEIRECLPEWTVNNISPLENIGEEVPAANYSYAQAGRLYESFRKKKRRPKAEVEDQAEGEVPSTAPARPRINDGIKLKVSAHSDEDGHWQQKYSEEYNENSHHGYAGGGGGGGGSYPHKAGYDQALPSYGDTGSGQGARPKVREGYSVDGHLYPEVRVSSGKAQSPQGDGSYSGASPGQSPGSHYSGSPPGTGHFRYDDQGPYAQSPSPYSNTNPGRSPDSYPTAPPRGKQRPSGYGNSQPAARSNPDPSTPRMPGQDPYTRPSPMQEDHEFTPLRNQFTRLQMQGSDRSSQSEAGSGVADSGICSDSDGHARDGSYEKPRQQYSPLHKYASDNHGFHHDDEPDISEAMRKHKELIAKMMGGASPEADSGSYDNRQQKSAAPVSSRDTSGYLPNRSNDVAPHLSKSGIPSPHSPNGYVDYTGTGNRNLQSRQQVEESFI